MSVGNPMKEAVANKTGLDQKPAELKEVIRCRS